LTAENMATARRIPPDRGLTARMFVTGLLLVVLFVGLGGVLAAIGFPIYWVIAIPAVLLFCQYWFSDKIALFGMHAHIVTPEEEPELHGSSTVCALFRTSLSRAWP
jgi:heat shock protein HtpX